MSETKPKRSSRLYIDDMIEFAERVLSYTHGLEQADFIAQRLTYDATMRNLELIGEAAAQLPEAFRQAHPQIPWRMIIATRNRIIHGYLGIDDDTIWSIIRDSVPSLLTQLRRLKPEHVIQPDDNPTIKEH